MIMFESIEVVMTAQLSEERHNGILALAANRESSSYSAPFFKHILFAVTHKADFVFSMFKAQMIAGLDPLRSANLHRDGDLALARDFCTNGSKWSCLCCCWHHSVLLTLVACKVLRIAMQRQSLRCQKGNPRRTAPLFHPIRRVPNAFELSYIKNLPNVICIVCPHMRDKGRMFGELLLIGSFDGLFPVDHHLVQFLH